MKRSEINSLIEAAEACFRANGWALPPDPKWDVTDFGLGDWRTTGLVLLNLTEQQEYCEKLMYAKRSMITPAHCHRRKKEDIICRWGTLHIRIWEIGGGATVKVRLNGEDGLSLNPTILDLPAGHRVTLMPGQYHEFVPYSEECIIGEVSTANDDVSDNVFVDSEIGRFPGIEEDEPIRYPLVGDRD